MPVLVKDAFQPRLTFTAVEREGDVSLTLHSSSQQDAQRQALEKVCGHVCGRACECRLSGTILTVPVNVDDRNHTNERRPENARYLIKEFMRLHCVAFSLLHIGVHTIYSITGADTLDERKLKGQQACST